MEVEDQFRDIGTFGNRRDMPEEKRRISRIAFIIIRYNAPDPNGTEHEIDDHPGLV
jgi:hypothetical protein